MFVSSGWLAARVRRHIWKQPGQAPLPNLFFFLARLLPRTSQEEGLAPAVFWILILERDYWVSMLAGGPFH